MQRGISRRTLLQASLPLLATLGSPQKSEALESVDSQPVVRVSRGAFPAESFDEIRGLLDASSQSLVPALKKLRGCLNYFASIDETSSTIINISVWQSLADAKQLDDFPPMRTLATQFVSAGVVFERPIANYETLWHL